MSLLDLAELFRRGCPPIPGGSLDQVNQFVEAARFVWRDAAYWRSKLNPFAFGD